MKKTIKYCPICGSTELDVEYVGNWRGRLGYFDVHCGNGCGCYVVWSNDEHEEGCECEMHEDNEPIVPDDDEAPPDIEDERDMALHQDLGV